MIFPKFDRLIILLSLQRDSGPPLTPPYKKHIDKLNMMEIHRVVRDDCHNISHDIEIKDVDKETKSISHHRNWVHWKLEITGLGLEGYDSYKYFVCFCYNVFFKEMMMI